MGFQDADLSQLLASFLLSLQPRAEAEPEDGDSADEVEPAEEPQTPRR